MATNVTLTQQPAQLWNSAYSDINFVFDFKEYSITNIAEEIISSVGTGYTKITISGSWDINPIKNEYVYVTSGDYSGLHRVLKSTNNSVVIDFDYSSALSGTVNIKHLRLPQFTLYKGFESGEQFADVLPYIAVTTFTYSFNQNIQIEINIKGLVQKIFSIQPPDLTSDYDFSVFNAVRLTWDDESTVFFLILNTSIPTAELNAKYVSGGLVLSNVDEPLRFGCGNTFQTIFEGGYPKLNIYNGTEEVTAGFNNAFQTNQFSQGYDIY